MATRLLNKNLLDLGVLASSFVSSEQTAFPIDNVYNQQRRSKVWRSNGYWEIVSGSNTIVFRESTGVDLTATITAGTYASTALLLAEIKSAMEFVGASTYTVITQTNTNKINITSDGSGGGGIFELRWSDVNSTAMAGVLGFDSSSNDTGVLTYTADVLKIHTSEWIKWDFGISTNPDVLVVIGKRNEPIQISPTATIKLQGNETDVWTSPSYDQTITYDSTTMSKFKTNDIDGGLHTESLRFWRLEIIDQDNPNGYIETGIVYLGDYFSYEKANVQFSFSGSYIDRSVTVTSEGGQTFSDEKQDTEKFGLDWYPLTNVDKDELDLFFNEFKTANPFFIQVDSGTAIGTTSDKYLRYVKLTAPISWSTNIANIYKASWSVQEQL